MQDRNEFGYKGRRTRSTELRQKDKLIMYQNDIGNVSEESENEHSSESS